MTRIIIDDVENFEDLTNAIAVVLRVFTNAEAYAEDEQYFSKHRPAEPAQPIAEIAAPVPYIPCPKRGTHLRLTDCWACWCDVRRGAGLEVDVLAADAWDLAVEELVGASQAKHRADIPPLTNETDYADRHSADVVEGSVVSVDKVEDRGTS